MQDWPFDRETRDPVNCSEFMYIYRFLNEVAAQLSSGRRGRRTLVLGVHSSATCLAFSDPNQAHEYF